jgi:hypothetical protein
MGTEQGATSNPIVPHLYFPIGIRNTGRRNEKSTVVVSTQLATFTCREIEGDH